MTKKHLTPKECDAQFRKEGCMWTRVADDFVKDCVRCAELVRLRNRTEPKDFYCMNCHRTKTISKYVKEKCKTGTILKGKCPVCEGTLVKLHNPR